MMPELQILNKNENFQIYSAAPQFRYIVAYFMVSMLLGGKFQGKMISVHTFKKGWWILPLLLSASRHFIATLSYLSLLFST